MYDYTKRKEYRGTILLNPFPSRYKGRSYNSTGL